MPALKYKQGFVLLWTLMIVSLFFSWVSITLKIHLDSILASNKKSEILERINCESKMRDKILEGETNFVCEGKTIRFEARVSDKKIIVNVDGTTKYNYVYAIMEDEGLVLVTTEE